MERKKFQPKKWFFPPTFWCSKPKESITGYSQHSKTYIFVKAGTLKCLFKAFSRTSLWNFRQDNFFRILSSWRTPDLEVCHMYLIYSTLVKLLTIIFCYWEKFDLIFLTENKIIKNEILKDFFLIPRLPSVFDVGVRNRYYIQNIFDNAWLII